MKELKLYIERQNHFKRAFNEKEYPSNPKDLSYDESKEIERSIEADLSPENLHCDGEISHSEAMKKKEILDKALEQLAIASN